MTKSPWEDAQERWQAQLRMWDIEDWGGWLAAMEQEMDGKPEPHAMWTKGTADDIARRYLAVCKERDELRTEVERRAKLEVWFTEAIDALHADIDHLKAELGEVTDLYTTYRGLVHDGVQVADVIKSVRGQLAALRISERAWTDQNTRLRAALTEITDMELEGDASLADAVTIADEALNPPPA